MSKNLLQMKTILYGDGEQEPNPELVSQLSQEIYQNDLLQLLVQNLSKLEFEVSFNPFSFLMFQGEEGCGTGV